MIKIKVQRRGEYARNMIQVSGHAEHNPGNDIVCAAISALVEQLSCYLRQNDVYAEMSVSPGDALIRSANPLADPLFDMTIFGMECIAHTYPDNVKVES